MKSRLLGAVCAFVTYANVISPSSAALVPKLGGLVVYDDDRDITWLANANAGAGTIFDDGLSSSDGRMSWANATAWAASLTVGGFTDWRLPTTPQPDFTCSLVDYWPPQGVNANCTGSDMGHLFYEELGGTAENSILTSGDEDLALFSNLQEWSYWSETIFEPIPDRSYHFNFLDGYQSARTAAGANDYAWAVHDGDISAIPIPPAVWLFGSGLIGLVVMSRRRKQS